MTDNLHSSNTSDTCMGELVNTNFKHTCMYKTKENYIQVGLKKEFISKLVTNEK